MRLGVILLIVLAPFVLLAQTTSPRACGAPIISNATTVDAVRAYFKAREKTVVTFVGYSGAEYEDKAAMLSRAGAILTSLDPRTTIVNVGATIDGIGAVYNLAHELGFETTGIVSSQARESGATLAPCAGTVFFVEDPSWGGLMKGTTNLSPTSTAIVGVSDRIVAIGGGEVARDEFEAARRSGKTTEFFPADMNHEIARARAKKNGQPPPTDFRGALGAALASSGRR
jgi:hypothetical protein